MDWLRSCYISEWHLFRDSPNTKTGGRYYFSPPDCDFVGVMHHYGSRGWYDGNYEILPSLGEDINTRQKWDRGDEPAVLPNAEQIGSDDCLTNGAAFNKALTTDGMRNGFPIACYTPAVALDPFWEIASSWDICSLQFFYATIIKWMYIEDEVRIRMAFVLLLGPLAETTYIKGTAVFPDLVICKFPTFTVVVADGTNSFQQLAMQAFAAISPPTNIGIYSTYPLWYAASTYIIDKMIALGVNNAKPLLVVGHSYGGVAMQNVAARLIAADDTRVIRAMTFGDPKPGDQRLKDLLLAVPGISLCNEEDIVCSIPPSRLVIFPVATALFLPILFVWTAWHSETNRARQNIDGELSFNVDPIIDSPLLTHLVNQIVLGQPFDTVQPHFISEYRRRIEVRCPRPEWPVSTILWRWLHDLPLAVAAVALTGGQSVAKGGIKLSRLVGKICPCCLTTPSPIKFTVKFNAPGYFFDGETVQIEEQGSFPGCFWLGFRLFSGNEIDAAVLAPNSSPGTIDPGCVVTDTSNIQWGCFNGSMTVTAFTCAPFFFSATGEIVTGPPSGPWVPTGDFATLEVVSVP